MDARSAAKQLLDALNIDSTGAALILAQLARQTCHTAGSDAAGALCTPFRVSILCVTNAAMPHVEAPFIQQCRM